MNVLTAPVLLGAALVSAPAFWGAFVDGTTEPSTALVRFLVAAALTWVALNVFAVLVGPAPKGARASDASGDADTPTADQPLVEPAG